MDISFPGTVFQLHHAVSPPLPLSSSLIISFPTRTAATGKPKKNSPLFYAATTMVAEPSSKGAETARKLHSRSYLARKRAIAEVENSDDLHSALERLGGILMVQDLNVILRQLGTQGRWKDLSQLFDWMQQKGKISVSTYSSYIKFIGKNSAMKALEIYHSIPSETAKANVFICNSVLSCLVKKGKFDGSIKLFDKMKHDGLTPDIITYNTLLSGFLKVKNGYSKAIELVQEMKSNGLQMDSVMYGTLLAICASNNQCEEARIYFDKMKNEGYSPNLYHYSSLLNAYSSNGDYTKADELVRDMKSSGLVPNKVILTTLLKVYARGGLFEKSRELLAELEASGFAEDEMPYCSLMDALSKAGRLEEAKSIFNEMMEKGVKSDGYSHSIMISALCRGQLFEEAKQLAQDFEAKYDKYDLVMLNTLLSAYCRAGEMESVMQMLRKMDELAISPDYNTFHMLIKYFRKEKLYLLAYRTMVDMHSKGHQPDEELCFSLIFHLGKIKAHSEAFSVYNMLRYSKRTMCKSLHEKILHILISGRLLKDAYVVVKDNGRLISHPALNKFSYAFTRWGNINMVNDVLKAIHGSGYKIGQGQIEMAVSRYIAQPEKKELLLHLLQWMLGQGYAVDSSTRNLLLKNSQVFGRQVIAEILSKHHILAKSSQTP